MFFSFMDALQSIVIQSYAADMRNMLFFTSWKNNVPESRKPSGMERHAPERKKLRHSSPPRDISKSDQSYLLYFQPDFQLFFRFLPEFFHLFRFHSWKFIQ